MGAGRRRDVGRRGKLRSTRGAHGISRDRVLPPSWDGAPALAPCILQSKHVSLPSCAAGKVKYLRSRDGFEFSRARFRREKRRWRERYGDPAAPGGQAPAGGGAAPEDSSDDEFAPQGLTKKIRCPCPQRLPAAAAPRPAPCRPGGSPPPPPDDPRAAQRTRRTATGGRVRPGGS